MAMVPVHAGNGLLDPLGFAAVAWFQLAVAALVLAGRADKRLYQLAAVGNSAVLGLWVWSRTAGLPVGAHAGVAEEIAAVFNPTAYWEEAEYLDVDVLRGRGDVGHRARPRP
jgi:hypothetical protein